MTSCDWSVLVAYAAREALDVDCPGQRQVRRKDREKKGTSGEHIEKRDARWPIIRRVEIPASGKFNLPKIVMRSN